MNYKKSSYIISNVDQKDQKLYLYHTDTGNIIYTHVMKQKELEQLFSEPNHTNVNIEAKEKLIETGFLVDEELDEFQQVQYKILDRNYNKSGYLELTILPTEQCNFRCVYCYEDFVKPEMSLECQEAIIHYVKRELVHRRGLSISWFGGEPLLAIPIIEKLSIAFIEICNQYKKPYHAGITTNGYILNLSLFEKLRKLKINHFQITLDGLSSTHDKQRVLAGGQPTFERIFENLCEIRDKGKGRMWNISLRTNVTKPMMEEIPEYTKLIQENFKNDRRFAMMIRKMWTNGTEESEEISCDDAEFYDFVESCVDAEYSVSQDYKLSHGQSFICYAGKPYAFVIGSDGALYKCTVAMDNPRNQVGIINEKGDFVFDSRKIAQWTIPKLKKINHCISCGFFAACGGNSCPMKTEVDACESLITSILPNLRSFSKIAEVSCDITNLL